MLDSSKAIQVDPVDCGCLECIVGLYVPLNHATIAQIVDTTDGRLSNGTSLSLNELWEYARDNYRNRRYY